MAVKGGMFDNSNKMVVNMGRMDGTLMQEMSLMMSSWFDHSRPGFFFLFPFGAIFVWS